MNRIMEYILIFSLFFLLFNHFILSTKEGLENKCTTTMQNGCRNIAIEKNTQSSTYTKTILNNAKKDILNLIKNLSKLFEKKNIRFKTNKDNIALNKSHIKKLNDAVMPN